MKKALRLLAMVMAIIMVMSAACLPTYAIVIASDYSKPDRYSGVQKYYFTAEQGCSYVLDMIDNMLAEENINPTWTELIGTTGDDILESATGVKSLDLRSIDNAIETLYTALSTLDDSGWKNVAIPFLGNVLKDATGLVTSYTYLDGTVKRNNGSPDLDVLFNIIKWLSGLEHTLYMLANGELDLGYVDLGDYQIVIDDLPAFIKKILYQLLIDSNFDIEKGTVPDGFTVDGAVQQVVDWALITGTGDTVETGGASLLGANTEALLPALGSEKIKAAGGASITAVPIEADRGNGVVVEGTMNTYQLVSNAIDALMSGTVKDMLLELLIDELDIDVNANGGKGNTEIMSDMTFALIVGAVEELFVKNGAPEIHYSADAQTYPIPKLNELMDWLLTGTSDTDPAIETFISLSYKGINLTDNFMSLLNDVARMLPSLLPAFGLELDSSLAYSASDLAATLSFNENKQVVLSSAEDAVTPLYLTYEEDLNGERIRIYPTEYTKDSTGVETPSKYAYFSDDTLVNTVDSSDSATYINPALVRPEYYISDAKVYANLIKLLLSSMIDGIYFPEWTEDIPSVAAYALAAVAMNIVPEGEWYDRLDAYYYNNTHSDNYVSAATGKEINADDDLDYTVEKTDSSGRKIIITYAAGEIGAAIGAYYLNGILDIQADEQLTVIGSSLEQFGFEFLIWAFKKYLPIFAGTYNATTGYFEKSYNPTTKLSLEGTWTENINACLKEVYTTEAGKAVNWNVVYDLLDQTLFNLIPVSWLPSGFDNSFDFVNKWLLDSIQNFDLQQLFSLFSIREGGELDTAPLLTVLIRVIDRVLLIVFGGNSVLIPERNLVFKNGGFYTDNTSITSLDGLISKESLRVFLPRLVTLLYQYEYQLCATIFPLIISANFLPAFDAGNTFSGTNYLGTDLTKYKISDLQNYLNKFNVGVNAKAIANTNDKSEAQATVKANAGSYIYTKTLNGVENYTVYQPIHFFTSATETAGQTDEATYKDSNGNVAGDTTYSTFTEFRKATLNTRTANNAFVSYTTDDYRFLEIEDFSNAYSYNNLESVLDDAGDFVNDYNSFGKGSESNGYGDWMKFYIQSNLKALNLYDANDDGVIDTNDGDPGAPKSSDYPFMTTASQNIEIYFAKTGKKVTVNMNEFNASLYEQIKIGLEYGADPENDISLSSIDAEPFVRLALKKNGGVDDARALAFDITPDADGNYHDGAYQWSGLTAAELQAISDFCASIDWTFTYDTAKGTYEIARPAFALITSLDFGNGITTTPASTRPEVTDDNKNIATVTAQRIYDGYVDYITTLYTNRRDLYNHINIIGKRAEMAENDRKGQRIIDVTSLEWLLKHTESAYIDSVSHYRNRKLTESGGYTKIYTASSYADFKKAYDFATSLVNAQHATAAAEGLTQSMVSKAFDELMDAFMGLVDFNGTADWYKLKQNLDLAEPFINNANAATDYTSDSFNALKESYNAAMAYYKDQDSYDSEQQNEIDAVADDLYAKIFEIVYIKDADLTVKSGSSYIKIQLDDTSTGAGIVKQGFIIGLKEGYGIKSDVSDGSIINSDNVDIVGMTINDDKNMTFKVAETTFGYGTGAYYTANNGVRTVFNYFAVLYGDLNGDMRIDGTDKTMLQWYISSGDDSFFEAAQKEAADVNHDGKVDAADIELIKTYIRTFDDTLISQTK